MLSKVIMISQEKLFFLEKIMYNKNNGKFNVKNS